MTIGPSGILSPESQAGGKDPTLVSRDAKDASLSSNSSIKSKPQLQRHQTFDATPSPSGNVNLQGADEELNLSVASAAAHSSRSHSCIAPVDVNIRRLSGGFNLVEETSIDVAAEDDQKKRGAEEVSDEKERSTSPPPPSIPPLASGLSSTRSSFAITRSENKRREALWDLFQSECVFLYDHLMVLKNVFMEPLKKIQVEGFAMFAEPEVLFGNLDELCCVTYAFCKEFLSIILHQMNCYEVNATEALVKLFQRVSSNYRNMIHLN